MNPSPRRPVYARDASGAHVLLALYTAEAKTTGRDPFRVSSFRVRQTGLRAQSQLGVSTCSDQGGRTRRVSRRSRTYDTITHPRMSTASVREPGERTIRQKVASACLVCNGTRRSGEVHQLSSSDNPDVEILRCGAVLLERIQSRPGGEDL
ncbi:unnamed protein product [Diplocarpon coronariae]